MEESVEAGRTRRATREETHREELTVVGVSDIAPPPPPPPPTVASSPAVVAPRSKAHEVHAGEEEERMREDDSLARDDLDLVGEREAPETSGDSGYSAEVELSDLLGGQTQSQSQPQI